MLVVFGRPADAHLARSGLSLQLLYVLLTVSAGSVAIRRLRPLVALGMSLAGFLGLASYGFGKFAVIPVALALYLVAVARPRKAAVGGQIVAELLVGFGYESEEHTSELQSLR